MYRTLKVRVKDKHAPALVKMGCQVNTVWNYINQLSHRSIREKGIFLSYFDMGPYIKESHQHFNLTMQTIKAITKEYTVRRKQFKKSKLRWRKSKGSGRSLGWIPVTKQDLKITDEGKGKYRKQLYSVFNSDYIKGYEVVCGSFNEDSRGRWYLNVTVKANIVKSKGTGEVGLDLGLKSTVTDSNGEGIAGREYRKLEDQLKSQQRANNKKQVRNIQTKIKNRRLHSIHTYSAKLVKENNLIVIGNVKLEAGKSRNDAGWSELKRVISYKCDYAGVTFKEVNESYSTVTCSSCTKRTGPSGLEGLRIRKWECSNCGAQHDRDVNAAINILTFGVKSGPLVEETTLINNLGV